jgi:hypothetical protein
VTEDTWSFYPSRFTPAAGKEFILLSWRIFVRRTKIRHERIGNYLSAEGYMDFC